MAHEPPPQSHNAHVCLSPCVHVLVLGLTSSQTSAVLKSSLAPYPLKT